MFKESNLEQIKSINPKKGNLLEFSDIKSDLEITAEERLEVDEFINKLNELQEISRNLPQILKQPAGLLKHTIKENIKLGLISSIKYFISHLDVLEKCLKRDSLARVAAATWKALEVIAATLKVDDRVSPQDLNLNSDMISAIIKSINDNFPRLEEIANKKDKNSVYALQAFDVLNKIGSRYDKQKTYQELEAFTIEIIEGFKEKPEEYKELIKYPLLSDNGDGDQDLIIQEIFEKQAENGEFKYIISFINSESIFLNAFSWTVISEYLTKKSLDATKFIEWWKQGYGDKDNRSKFIKRHLENIHTLNTKYPNAVQVLNSKFNIYDFGRYPMSVLETQYKEIENKERPYGIILYPKNDYNGAFNYDIEIYENLLKQIKEKYNLRVVECTTKRDIARRLISLSKEYGPASFAIIGGHGEPDHITFGNRIEERDWMNPEKYKLSKEDFEGSGVRRGVKFFTNNPTFILVSCSTGQQNGIGQKLSQVFNAKVIAPETSTNIKKINAEINEDNSLNFSALYHDSSEKNYSQGEPLENK